MQNNAPATLTYSAPKTERPPSTPERGTFFNAFPELNDKADDGSRSAHPVRAKYSLALDSFFLPSAAPPENRHLALFAAVTSDARRVEQVLEAGPRATRSVLNPLEDKDRERFQAETAFEIAHKRLGATDYKYAFRCLFLAPFYTKLAVAVATAAVRGERIEVPLIPNPEGSELERQWASTVQHFRPTEIVDEVVSLLTGVVLQGRQASPTQEASWVAEENNEIKGFSGLYSSLRDLFRPEANLPGPRRMDLAERILTVGKAALVWDEESWQLLEKSIPWLPAFASNPAERLTRLVTQLKEASRRQRRSNLMEQDLRYAIARLFDSPRRRSFDGSGFTVLRPTTPDSVQRVLARAAIGDEAFMNFRSTHSTIYPRFTFHRDERNVDEPTIVASIQRKIGRWPGLDPLDHLLPGSESAFTMPFRQFYDFSVLDFCNAPHEDLAAWRKSLDWTKLRLRSSRTMVDRSIASMLFMESLRQQICLGVGLQCPFRRGTGCCGLGPTIHGIYKATRPAKPRWAHLWQEPRCAKGAEPR